MHLRASILSLIFVNCDHNDFDWRSNPAGMKIDKRMRKPFIVLLSISICLFSGSWDSKFRLRDSAPPVTHHIWSSRFIFHLAIVLTLFPVLVIISLGLCVGLGESIDFAVPVDCMRVVYSNARVNHLIDLPFPGWPLHYRFSDVEVGLCNELCFQLSFSLYLCSAFQPI